MENNLISKTDQPKEFPIEYTNKQIIKEVCDMKKKLISLNVQSILSSQETYLKIKSQGPDDLSSIIMQLPYIRINSLILEGSYISNSTSLSKDLKNVDEKNFSKMKNNDLKHQINQNPSKLTKKLIEKVQI